jgi:hypothetical protein
MPETTDQLASVTMNGQTLAFSHGVLIHAMHGWHVALYQVPIYACPLTQQNGYITIKTVAGRHLAGRAVTEFVTDNGGYVLLTGIGQLKAASPTRAA